ncbi:unnamed protein product [Nyctereutes procyonoides]|uniref:(raccoon dog) hypothetical protein n=1 Tax=Nyctereutes procyonoides TaxID=34880 RepID=A0A811XSK3_NYCPR|nr:unnamed protein product [Nyctereutes procyonoides]
MATLEAWIQPPQELRGSGGYPYDHCFKFSVGVGEGVVGMILAVYLLQICLLFIILHCLYWHKGTYHTMEAKGTEFA